MTFKCIRNDVLSEVLQLPCLDRRRVHCTGYSNGARFCMRLASEMSDLIASVAPVSGGDFHGFSIISVVSRP